MPLNTQVLAKNGKPRKDIVWSGFEGVATLNAFLTVGLKEGDPELVYFRGDDGERKVGDLTEGQFLDLVNTGVYYIDTEAPLWREGRHVVREDHTFFKDSEHELTFRAGETLRMWRD